MLPVAIKSVGELPEIHIYFLKGKASNGLDGIFTEKRLHGIFEGKDDRQYNKMFPFKAAFIDRSMSHEKSTHDDGLLALQ